MNRISNHNIKTGGWGCGKDVVRASSLPHGPVAEVIKQTAKYHTLSKRQEITLDTTMYSPTRSKGGESYSSPSRWSSPTRKNVNSRSGQKEIKFNYYDPQAYDDPHQFYQWHKEKVQMDLCGTQKEKNNLGSAFYGDMESSFQTDFSPSHRLYAQ